MEAKNINTICTSFSGGNVFLLVVLLAPITTSELEDAAIEDHVDRSLNQIRLLKLTINGFHLILINLGCARVTFKQLHFQLKRSWLGNWYL